MTRLELIHAIHKKVVVKNPTLPKPKRVVKGRPTKYTGTKEERRRQSHKSFRLKRRSGGICLMSCQKESVTINYQWDNEILISTSAKYCPYHWVAPSVKQEMLDAISARIKPTSTHNYVDALSVKPDTGSKRT